MKIPLSLIPYPFGAGASSIGAEDGPLGFVEAGLAEKLRESGLTVEWDEAGGGDWALGIGKKILTNAQSPMPNPQLFSANRVLFSNVCNSLHAHQFPITLGGDHTMAVATWHAVAAHYQAHQTLGLIWIDAHLDAHTPETSHSGAYHGMPLACLLGYGNPEWTSLFSKFPALAPEHISVIGVRSFEPEEKAFLEHLRVRIYYMEEVHARGMSVILDEALARATAGTKGFGITLDLDGIDPIDAPGVGLREANGVRAEELCEAIALLRSDPRFSSLLALEFAEYHPRFDSEDKRTVGVVSRVIETVLAEKNSLPLQGGGLGRG